MTYDGLSESDKIGNPDDLARQLGEKGINKLLEIVCAAYAILYKNRIIKPKMSEDEITEELFKEIVIAWSKPNIPKTVIPINQKIDKNNAKNIGRPPTIDFCFRDRWTKEAFFGFECKLLAESNNRLCDEYIKNGLYRFIEGKYCARGSAGSMIGYINSGNVATIVSEVRTRVNKERIMQVMALASSILTFKEHYVSIHSRDKGLSPFCIHHLFFCFVTFEKVVSDNDA